MTFQRLFDLPFILTSNDENSSGRAHDGNDGRDDVGDDATVDNSVDDKDNIGENNN